MIFKVSYELCRRGFKSFSMNGFFWPPPTLTRSHLFKANGKSVTRLSFDSKIG